MPAYSFKERFIPFIKDGSKPQTIRKRRSNQKVEVGSTLYLYYGMRTKYCTKLREEFCTRVQTIKILKDDKIFLCRERLKDTDFDRFINLKCNPLGKYLNDDEKNILAWKDGFRPEGSSLENPTGCFELMMRFWRQTHDLPFYGDLISWYPKNTFN